MKFFTIIVLSGVLFSCSDTQGSEQNAPVKDSIPVSDTIITSTEDQASSIISEKPEDTIHLQELYSRQKAEALSKKNFFKSKFNDSDSAYSLAREFLYNHLLNEIIPPWYGTAWDFNGYTDQPNKGFIACGYFVSTTLKHLGFNLNRYKVAQQYSLKIIEILCGKENVKTWQPDQFDAMINFLKDGGNDIFVVGLSCHVGYLSVESDTVYFIHSSYVHPLCVIKEYAELSEVLKSSGIFVTGSLLQNKELIRKWVYNEPIVVE
ncbi:MAG TPA: hypothetical protein DEA97_08730 [Bacteroidales bacterium]|nr:hypothetical protein [Bacteroidales bacterium]